MLGDEDATKKAGIYEYLLTGDERALSIRAFDRRDAQAAYERQGHKCALCGEEFEFGAMQADHIVPWSKGGKTTPDNCQTLCRDCNLRKSNK
ncbi:MAG: HNH endonuclease [Desulfovibrio sp.]|nr:HNH endonuclease [Desulfovibrio sp.]